MANPALRSLVKLGGTSSRLKKIHVEQIRHGHHLRGKPPHVALTLQQRLELLRKQEPNPTKVNIGFSVPRPTSEEKEAWMAERKIRRTGASFEKEVRSGELSLNLEEARKIWLETTGPYNVRKIADHYGIYQDLFGNAFFFPAIHLDVNYSMDDDTLVKVCTGNVIKPAEARESPNVAYKAQDDTLWTLVMCTPDGNLVNSNNEYCHWFLGNIPGNKVEQGERITDYSRPIPVRGAGYYRYVFILYKQNRRLDYTEYERISPCLRLKERDWNTLEFYRKYQDHLTPAGLAFFQSDWDPTVKEFYHSVLDAKEPIFRYDFPKAYVKPQTWFPLRQSFNLYLDKYKDPKDTAKEFLLRKLKTVHPFKEPKPPLKYPNARVLDLGAPSWLRVQRKKERLGWGRVHDSK